MVKRAHDLKWEELNLSSNHNYWVCNVSDPNPVILHL